MEDIYSRGYRCLFLVRKQGTRPSIPKDLWESYTRTDRNHGIMIWVKFKTLRDCLFRCIWSVKPQSGRDFLCLLRKMLSTSGKPVQKTAVIMFMLIYNVQFKCFSCAWQPGTYDHFNVISTKFFKTFKPTLLEKKGGTGSKLSRIWKPSSWTFKKVPLNQRTLWGTLKGSIVCTGNL